MTWWKWTLVGLGALVVVPALALAAYVYRMSFATGDPAFFEDEIAAYEAADREAPPAPGGIVFVGSSSVRLWSSLAEDMAPLPVVNRGFGGAQLEHILHNAERVVTRYAPRIVVVYVGGNDLGSGTGKDAAHLEREYRALGALIHESLPDTQIYCLAIKPTRLRWSRWPEARDANARLEMWTQEDPRLHYVDVSAPLLKADGTLRDDVFLFDGLHLNATGYAEWTRVLRPILVEAWAAGGSKRG